MRARIRLASVKNGKEIWRTIGDIVLRDGKLSVEPAHNHPHEREMLQDFIDVDWVYLKRRHKAGDLPEDLLTNLHRIMGRYGSVKLIDDGFPIRSPQLRACLRDLPHFFN
jgi:hypothetical protein